MQGSLRESIYDEKDLATPPQPGDQPDASEPHRLALSVGGMTCASCSNAITSALSELPGVADVNVNLLGNSATLTISGPDVAPSVVAAVEDIGYTAEVVSSDPLRPPQTPKHGNPPGSQFDGPLRVELSVDGMTCASCVNTVTGLLSDIPGVSEVAVNLIGKSATAVIQRRDIAPQLKEAIDDAGYEAEVIAIHSLEEPTESDVTGPRTVSLRINGMFCS